MTNSPGRFLRQKEVTLETGLPKSTLYWLIGRGEFPRPRKLSRRAVGWTLQDVQSWKDSRQVA